MRYFPALLPVCEDEDPREVLEAGDVPQLGELRLHNGTVYRWNRPIYEVVRERPHVRVENRLLPAGPTVVDTIANAAFYYGLVRVLAEDDRPLWSRMSFSAAEENFHAGARDGIEAQVYWPGVGEVPAAELVLRRLLPLAHEGFDRWGIDSADGDRLLGIVERRCVTMQNGAAWQSAVFHHLYDERRLERSEALRRMTVAYREHMHANEPVDAWPVPDAEPWELDEWAIGLDPPAPDTPFMALFPERGVSPRLGAALACAAVLASAVGVSVAVASDPSISTVAGNGTEGSSGDGAAATLAELGRPADVALVPAGGFLIADTKNNRIREVALDGEINTVAGTGNNSFSGDSGPAVAAELDEPLGVAPIVGGGFLIADTKNDRIREVAPDGTIDTVAGGSGPSLADPHAVAPLPGGGFLVADTGNHLIRMVDALGASTVVAGTGNGGYTGDGGPAVDADIDDPHDVAPLAGGGFLFADYDEDVVRRVDALGTITTVAGGGSSGAEGIPATDAKLDKPAGVAPLAGGGFLVALEGDHSVRRVSADGVIETVAGSGSPGFGGDLGNPLAATFDSPVGIVATLPGDHVLVADSRNNRIRDVSLPLGAPPEDPGPDERAPEPTTGRQQEPGGERQAPRQAPPPVLGKSVTVSPAKGTVRVRRPRSKRFVRLTGSARVPVGSIIDVIRGRVSLSSALDRKGKTQTAQFWAGVFQVRQSRSGRGMTDIVLHGAKPRCSSGRRGRAKSSAKRKRRRARRLWAKDKRGRFRTRGSNSVATTRGTLWVTAENCTGTATKVLEGSVVVRNRHTGRKRTVRAGQRYVARRPR